MPPIDRLYDVRQAAQVLGIGRTNVYKLLKDGRLHSVRVGRLRRIRRSDLDAYIENLEAAGE